MPGGFRRARAHTEKRVGVDRSRLRRALAGEAGVDDARGALLDRLDAEADRRARPGRIEGPTAAVTPRPVRRLVRSTASREDRYVA